MAATPCPRSATHALVGWSGAAGLLMSAGVLSLRPWPLDIADQALIVMACTALGVFVPDLCWQRVHRRQLTAPAAGNWPRTLTKLVGLGASLGWVALLYGLFPEYDRGGDFYAHYWHALRRLLPVWGALALPYLYFIDRRLSQPQDALWQMGRCALLRWRGLPWHIVWQHLLGWLVKGFFLPLMFAYFCEDMNALWHYDPARLRTFAGFYDWLYSLLYFVDVALVCMTYLMSLRLTDTHIRSTEPTFLGWGVALLCYQPFWSLIGRQYLRYDTGPSWGAWLGTMPTLYALWGSTILLLIGIYVWATISFGARFSNLTHRGIITNGPYRFSKHPAYLAKNLSWWLISVPFLAHGGALDGLRRCALLLLLNLVYYLRAKTEERHLSMDPVYVAYSDYIAARGLLRGLDRLPLIGGIARWRPKREALPGPSQPLAA